MNKVILIGRMTKDPELRMTSSNTGVCNFSLAVDKFTRDPSGPTADFVPVVVWDKQAENLAKYIKKGDQIAVDGRIQTRSYDDKDGKRVYVTEVVAGRIMFLSNRGKDSSSNYEQNDIKPSDMKVDNDPYEDFGKSMDEYETINDFLSDDNSYETPF